MAIIDSQYTEDYVSLIHLPAPHIIVLCLLWSRHPARLGGAVVNQMHTRRHRDTHAHSALGDPTLSNNQRH